jgi:predicted ATPase
MIRSIRIEHYKSVAQARLTLEKTSVLVGSNSAGKSNFIDAIAFLRDAVVHGLEQAVSDRHGIDSIIQWSPTRPYNLEIELEYETDYGSGRYTAKLSSKARQPRVLEESGTWHGTPSRPAPGIYFTREKNNVKLYGVSEKATNDFNRLFGTTTEDELFLQHGRYPYPDLQGLRYLNSALRDFKVYNIYPNTIRTPQKTSNDEELSSTGDNLHSILKIMVGSKSAAIRSRYQEIISTMSRIIPNLERILVKNVSGLLWPIFEVRDSDGRGHQYNVSQISDGALRVLGILTALYQPFPPRVIAIEEPEQNIHPGALSLIAEAFKDISEQTQIITTTHSPHMLDYFSATNIFPTEFQDGRTVVGAMSTQQKKAIVDKLLTASEVMTSQGFEVE